MPEYVQTYVRCTQAESGAGIGASILGQGLRRQHTQGSAPSSQTRRGVKNWVFLPDQEELVPVE